MLSTHKAVYNPRFAKPQICRNSYNYNVPALCFMDGVIGQISALQSTIHNTMFLAISVDVVHPSVTPHLSSCYESTNMR